MGLVIKGESISEGEAKGALLVTSKPLSFWGGYDQATGEIIDRRHDLSGEIAANKILAFPFTVGSSTTTAILLESVRAGVAPAAFIMKKADHFIALACVVAEEMYGKRLPLIVVGPEEFASLQSGALASIRNGVLEIEDA